MVYTRLCITCSSTTAVQANLNLSLCLYVHSLPTPSCVCVTSMSCFATQRKKSSTSSTGSIVCVLVCIFFEVRSTAISNKVQEWLTRRIVECSTRDLPADPARSRPYALRPHPPEPTQRRKYRDTQLGCGCGHSALRARCLPHGAEAGWAVVRRLARCRASCRGTTGYTSEPPEFSPRRLWRPLLFAKQRSTPCTAVYIKV